MCLCVGRYMRITVYTLHTVLYRIYRKPRVDLGTSEFVENGEISGMKFQELWTDQELRTAKLWSIL